MCPPNRIRPCLPPIAILLAAALAGCGSNPHRPDTQGRPVLELIKRATFRNENGHLSSEPNLIGVARVGAAGERFEVAARTASMQRFPCSRCHDRPLDKMKRPAPGKKAAHWDVTLKHATEGVMSCETCHQLKQATDTLHTLRGESVEFNHSYQVCGQCHSRQMEDWKGGAHGKRLGGWAPPRVVTNCAGCHNPHTPQIQKRWPAIAGAGKETAAHE